MSQETQPTNRSTNRTTWMFALVVILGLLEIGGIGFALSWSRNSDLTAQQSQVQLVDSLQVSRAVTDQLNISLTSLSATTIALSNIVTVNSSRLSSLEANRTVDAVAIGKLETNYSNIQASLNTIQGMIIQHLTEPKK